MAKSRRVRCSECGGTRSVALSQRLNPRSLAIDSRRVLCYACRRTLGYDRVQAERGDG